MPMPDAPIAPLQPHARVSLDAAPGQQLRTVRTSRRGVGGGIDVSHYQGRIDWREVARSGEVQYVYLKATEGSDLIDNTFRYNLSSARMAGFKVGVYHFYRPGASIESQFANLTSQVALRDMDLLPIIDVESRGRASLPDFQEKLLRFVRLVERHYGVRPIIYTSRDFYNKYLAGPFSNYKYMIARYHTDIPELVDDAAFVMWQYTSSGRVRGIRGNVDRSCFMDDYGMKDILMPRFSGNRMHER
ncbi:MAG: glycosyl hydrolase family 25 [Bacteroidaceae bacterium]|nr:glycosyl hydrolase family 25 [Bacteroidaceae bacterium]